MTQTTTWVHRYTLRELLDDSFDLFKERATTLLLAGVLPYVLVVAYLALMRFYVLPENFTKGFFSTGKVEDLFASEAMLNYLLGLMLCSCIAGSLSMVAQCRVALYHAFGLSVSLRHCYRRLFKPFLSLLVVSIIYSVFVTIAVLVALMVAGIIVGIVALLGSLIGAVAPDDSLPGMVVLSIVMAVLFYLLMMAAIVLVSTLFLSAPAFIAYEHDGPFAALSKSFSVASANYRANALALYVIIHVPTVLMAIGVLIAMALSYGLQQVAPAAGDIVGMAIGSVGYSLTFTAIIACFCTASYIDGKCRLEALDLRVMAADIGMDQEIEQAFRPVPKRTLNTPVANNYPVYTANPTSTSPTSFSSQTTISTYATAASPFPDYSAPPPPMPDSAVVTAEVAADATTEGTPADPPPPATDEAPAMESVDAQ